VFNAREMPAMYREIAVSARARDGPPRIAERTPRRCARALVRGAIGSRGPISPRASNFGEARLSADAEEPILQNLA